LDALQDELAPFAFDLAYELFSGYWGQAFDFRFGPPDDSQYAMAQ
jgi:hypothetical protein